MIFGIVLLIVAVPMLWIRFAPTSVKKYHVDPENVVDRGMGLNSYLVSHSELKDLEPVQSRSSASIVFGILNDYLLDELNGKLLSGSATDAFATFVVRSKWMGYPDFVSVTVTNNSSGCFVQIYSRSRFGIRDFGVNKARVKKMLSLVPN